MVYLNHRSIVTAVVYELVGLSIDEPSSLVFYGFQGGQILQLLKGKKKKKNESYEERDPLWLKCHQVP